MKKRVSKRSKFGVRLSARQAGSSEFGVFFSKDKYYELRTHYSELFFPQSKGFTLIELILIMIIIGILAVMVVPRIDFTISTPVSLDGAASIVASDIRYAQEYAMANRVTKEINFTQNSSTYTFNPSSSLDPSGRLPEGIRISSSTYTLRFNSLGEPISIPVADSYVDVTVSDGTTSKRIRIWNFTGKAEIL